MLVGLHSTGMKLNRTLTAAICGNKIDVSGSPKKADTTVLASELILFSFVSR